MKKIEAKTQILYIRISKETKEFICKAAFKLFGTKRKEAPLVNMIMEDLRDNGVTRIRDN